MTDWSVEDSAHLYGIDDWGAGYFGISERGTVEAYPDGDRSRPIDLDDVMRGLAGREIGSPLIVRLPGILGHRMRHLRHAFDTAITDAGYGADYSCVYPIKVNQERHICEAIRDFGAELGFGLEVGSKPELVAGLALTRSFDEMPLVCNGFKDTEYVETVVLASKMGRTIIPVVEQVHELKLIADSAARHDALPDFGLRAKLATPGVGRWASSAGFRGKFGLTVGEILHAVEFVESEGLLDGLKMLHCHVGSQIFDIRTVKYVVAELAHLYVELVRAGAPVEILDLGGGLGVDYDGSGSASDSSIDYTLEQYASDIVYRVKAVCDEAGVPHPRLMTESGRALVAHSSVLVCEVIGSRRFRTEPDRATIAAALDSDDPPRPLIDLADAFERLRIARDESPATADERAGDDGSATTDDGSSTTDDGSATTDDGNTTPDDRTAELDDNSTDLADRTADLADRRADLDDRELLEIYADAAHALSEATDLFTLGYMDLGSRAACEELYWAVGSATLEHFGDDLPESLSELPDRLADLFFVNLSVFQSLLDSWGIGQLFPVMPLHRLDERPTRHGILADITCDSDGRIDRFPGEDGPKTTLELHDAPGGTDFTQNGDTPAYYLGIFLTGAYQETLGDLHNLLGDTNAVHVTRNDDGGWRIETVVEGESVADVLRYVQYDPDDIRRRLHQDVEAALERRRLTLAEGASLRRFLDESLQGYTYLE